MDRTFSSEEIVASHPLRSECERAGLVFKRQGAEWYSKCPFHQDGGRPNFRINEEKGTWFCDVCGDGGSSVEFAAKLSGRPKSDVFKEWAIEMGSGDQSGGNGHMEGKESKVVCSYDYRNEAGDLVFQVCRMEPKTFRQRRMVNGTWEWSLQGVTRMLYRLPQVLNSSEVWVVEGEKDADNLSALGFCATCNVGGAGKWLDGYTDTLRGKNVILCGDNDDPGRQHIDKVLVAIRETCRSVKIVRVPEPNKDASDWIKTLANESAAAAFRTLADSAPIVGGLYAMPIRSMEELDVEYAAYAKSAPELGLDLSNWLPSLRDHVRPLVPGELAVILADTGTGKTALLQNLAFKSKITTLLFELELPGTLTFERFIAIATRLKCSVIEEGYRAGESGQINFKLLSHIWTCTKSNLTIADMMRLIKASELKIGSKPALVLVDYVQLVAGEGKNRYERTSGVAEQLKVMAKETNTIVVAASQIGRKDYSAGVSIGLHDGKNSGEIENSSGLVLGAWRDEEDSSHLILKVLKNTKGRSGFEVSCNFNGETMRIDERSKIRPEDVGNFQ